MNTRLDKNKRISESFKSTRLKRQSQVCRVFTVKVDKSSLNDFQKEQLKMMFVEAKWLYNFILSKSKEGVDIFKIEYKDFDIITHKDKDQNDIKVSLNYLGSSIKQDLIKGLQSSIKSLSSKKKKRIRIGTLKFKSEINSISLKQLGITHKIIGSRIKVQGIKKALRVSGLKQLKSYKTLEIASNAKLVQKNGDYYIALTCYVSKEEIENLKPTTYKNQIIGIDFGCSTSLTFSNGEKINAIVEESEPIKRLQRKIKRQQKGSKNYWKTRIKLRKCYQKISNKKNDLANKICHKILQENKVIIIQDEQINSWKVQHGKKVQHGILGRIKLRLSMSDQTSVLSKWLPTTKLCTACGQKYEMTLNQRTFKCSCGVQEDRDIHAAKNMIWFYENLVGVERTEYKLAEFERELKKNLK